MTGVVDLFPGGLTVVAGEFDLEVFAHVYGAYSVITHVFQGVLDRFSLRIEDGLFRCNNNFCFHVNAGGSRKQPGNVARRNQSTLENSGTVENQE